MTPEDYIKSHPEDTEYADAYKAKRSAELSHAALAPVADPRSLSTPLSDEQFGPPAAPQRPPEFHPPAAQKPGLLGAVSEFARTLPGMGTTTFKEPSLAEFRAETGRRDLGLDSPEYQAFADRKYADTFDEHAAAGQGIVRPSKSGRALVRMAGDAQALPDVAVAAIAGADPSLGLLSRVAPAAAERAGLAPKGSGHVLEDLMEEHPIASLGGGLGGVMTGVGKSLFDAATKALGPAGGAAAAAGAAKLGENVSGAAADYLVDDSHPYQQGEGRKRVLDSSTLLAQPLLAAAGGAVLGELGGRAAQSTQNIRSDRFNPGVAPELRALENAGGRLRKRGIIPGFDPLEVPRGVAENFDVSRDAPPDAPIHSMDVATGKVAPGIAKNIAGKSSELEEAWTGPFGFLNRYEAHVPQPLPVPNTAKALERLIEEHTLVPRSGNQPSVDVPSLPTAQFKRWLNDLHEVSKPAPSIAKGGGENGRVMTVKAAQEAGYDVSGPPGYKVLITPRDIPVQKFELMMRSISDLAKEGAPETKPALTRLLSGGRTDRDAFPWPASLGPEPVATLDDGRQVRGFSAKHTLEHQKLRDFESQLKPLGIQKTRDMRAADVEDQVGKAARSYGTDGSQALDKALRELAGGDALLREIPATHAVPKLGEALRFLKSGSTKSAATINAAKLRLDPILGTLGDVLPRAAVPAASGNPVRAAKALPGAASRGMAAASDLASLIRELYQ